MREFSMMRGMKSHAKPATQLADALARAPHFACAHLPTPLAPLKRLSAHLGGANLWIKRDDCTGLATGGNKARKLEYLIGAAIAGGADTVLTHGALQSNHVRQTAAAAAKANLKCEILYEHRVANMDADADYAVSGNVLLTELFGVTRSDHPADTDMDAAMAQRAAAVRARGGKPYLIAGGGSNAVGALGYAKCALELHQQAARADLVITHVVHATGSTGTQAGLLAGGHGLHDPFPILGIGVRLPRAQQEQKVFELARATVEHLGLKRELARERVHANCDYVGAGYGLPTDGMREAVLLLARLEGILLDPVYAGKGMAGLIDLTRNGFFKRGENVVFVHTGGSAALFGYRSVFAESGAAEESP